MKTIIGVENLKKVGDLGLTNVKLPKGYQKRYEELQQIEKENFNTAFCNNKSGLIILNLLQRVYY